MSLNILGLPLEEACRRLEAEGIRPAVIESRSPRRQREGEGALRVVRVQAGGQALTVCAFITDIREPKDA